MIPAYLPVQKGNSGQAQTRGWSKTPATNHGCCFQMSLCDKSPADRFKRWQRKLLKQIILVVRWHKTALSKWLKFHWIFHLKCVCLDLIPQPGADRIHTGEFTQVLVLAQGRPRPKTPRIGSKLHLSHTKDVPCRSKLRLFIGHNKEILNALKKSSKLQCKCHLKCKVCSSRTDRNRSKSPIFEVNYSKK